MGFHTVSTSNPQPISTQACARRTAQWMPEDNRVFITACEIIIVDKHRSGKCFTKHGWHKIVQLFNANSGHDWSRYQLKNHWDYLRVKYKHLENLTDSIDIARDSARCSLVASDKWWARKIKVQICLNCHFSNSNVNQHPSIRFICAWKFYSNMSQLERMS